VGGSQITLGIRQYALVTERTSDGDLNRLRLNIQEELRAQNAMRGLGLEDAVLDALGDALAITVDYAFYVKWSPRWVKSGEAHYWAEPDEEMPTGENHFAECLLCEWVSGSNPTRRDAEQKYGRHRQAEHSSDA
jgi:hypothetical protein